MIMRAFEIVVTVLDLPRLWLLFLVVLNPSEGIRDLPLKEREEEFN